MARAFTDAESAQIRERLLAAAADSFSRRGIRATSVESLARTAGISKGAFYGFFDSKEALFLALMEQSETETQADVLAAVAADPGRGIEAMIDAALEATQRHPLIGVALSDEGLVLLRTMTPEQRQSFLRRDEVLVGEAVELLTAAGVHLQVPTEVLVGLLRSLVFVGWHRSEIGDDLVGSLAQWLTPALRAALLRPPQVAQ